MHIDEALCNGCGSCIPKCAEGALQVVSGKARIVSDSHCDGLGACIGHCPQGAITIMEREAEDFDEKAARAHVHKTEAVWEDKPPVTQWPVKFNLVPVAAAFFEKADLLIAADCAPVACVSFRGKLMRGKRVIIGCPKFDDAEAYAQTLGEILKRNNVASITVAHMEVPCCSGLMWAVDKAVATSGKQISVKQYVIAINGKIK
ncbi:MAG: 4Fe-4S ferredoxin [Candidatus Bathyarchaeota archaeon]|nr:4Fe-4S ferredoxin [Candidatus Bathyarchaeota archaeon]